MLAAGALPSWIHELEAAEAAAVDKDKLADLALSKAKSLGASYADIRVNRYRVEYISTREKQVQQVGRYQSFGFGVRVLVKGSWGFAASRDVSAEEVELATRRGVEIARANASFQTKPVRLALVKKATTHCEAARTIDGRFTAARRRPCPPAGRAAPATRGP